MILVEDWLTAGFSEQSTVLKPALAIALFGTLITAALTGLAAMALFGFSTLEALLVGSILAGTDGAAVFALLPGSTLRPRLAKNLEGEARLDEPDSVLLVVAPIATANRTDHTVGHA